LMAAYASSVAIALIGITVLAVKVYMHIQDKVIHYAKYLPKISAVVLAAMAISFAVGFL
jgi:nickel/cobalt transporter (NicO) family protein